MADPTPDGSTQQQSNGELPREAAPPKKHKQKQQQEQQQRGVID
jgi:hypothetical protein